MISNLVADCQRRAVGRPIGVGHVVEQLARRSPTQRNVRQPPDGSPLCDEVGIQQHRQFSGGGDAQNAAMQVERLRFGSVCACGKKFHGLAVAGSGVNYGAAIRSKARMAKICRTKSNLCKCWMACLWMIQQQSRNYTDR